MHYYNVVQSIQSPVARGPEACVFSDIMNAISSINSDNVSYVSRLGCVWLEGEMKRGSEMEGMEGESKFLV